MINTKELDELLYDKREVFKRSPQRLLSSTTNNYVDDFYTLEELYLDPSEEENWQIQLFNSSKKLVGLLNSIGGRTALRIVGDGTGKLRISFSNTHSGSMVNVLKGSFGSVSFKKDPEQTTIFSKNVALTYTPALMEDSTDPSSWLLPFLNATYTKSFSVTLIIQKRERVDNGRQLEELYTKWHHKQKQQVSQSMSESIQKQEGSNVSRGGSAVILTKNASSNTSVTTSEDISKDESLEYGSYLVEKFLEFTKFHMNRLEKGESSGLFQVGLFISTDDEQVIKIAQGSITSTQLQQEYGEAVNIMTNEQLSSYIKTLTLPSDSLVTSILQGYCHPMTNLMTSDELSSLLILPSISFEGFELKTKNDFEVANHHSVADERSWHMGKLFERNILSAKSIHFPYENLTSHCLVSGITGSGKTNTVMSLIQNSPVPYLIIEPTKQEYRHLLSINKDLRLYTLGDEKVSPIRLNPFYFPDGISVTSHIDSLKAVFMSAFSMHASMPNILEQCLYSVYQRIGWDLSNSINIYANENLSYEHFPTLELLYDEIDDYLNKSGYAEEQKSNIRAALLTRLKSLMTGSKGKLLNTQQSIEFYDIINYPTVIELEEIADEDDKALIMGLFFIRLAEEFKVNAPAKLDSELRHFTVIEEAHRLFKNHSESQNPEIANTKGKAVEFFTNILSEVRSKGAGIVIVDQVPTKLAPDALKNTDTKIIHRLVSKDDAEYVAQALGLSNEQDLLFLSQLKRGEVLYFTSGMYKSAHALIHAAKENIQFVPPAEIRKYAIKTNKFTQNDEISHPIANHILSQDSILLTHLKLDFRKLYMNAIYGEIFLLPEALVKTSINIMRNVQKFGYQIPPTQEMNLVQSLLIGLLEKFIKEDAFYRSYQQVVEEITYFLKLIFENYDYVWTNRELAQLGKNRDILIYTQLKIASERKLFNEATYSWMENEREFCDADAAMFAEYYRSVGTAEALQNGDLTEQAIHLYKKVIEKMMKEFAVWGYSSGVRLLLLRILIQLTNNRLPKLNREYEVIIEKEGIIWRQQSNLQQQVQVR